MKILLGLFCSLFFTTALFADVEIIVTANRVDEAVTSVPSSVKVIPAAQLQGKSLLDVLATLPELSVQTFSPGLTSIQARGFGENGFGKLLVLVDGVRQNRPDMSAPDLSQIPMANVDKIEILMGTQSVVYGDSSIAGVINIITKKSVSKVEASVSSTVDNLGGNHESGNLLVPMAPQWTLQVSAAGDSNQAARDRSYSYDYSGAAKLTWAFAPGQFVTVSGSYAPTYYQMPGSLTQVQASSNPNLALNQSDDYSSQLISAGLDSKVRLGDFTLVTPLSFTNKPSQTNFGSGSYPSWYDTNIKTVGASPTLIYSFAFSDQIVTTFKGLVDFSWAGLTVNRYDSLSRQNQTSTATLNRLSYAEALSTNTAFGDDINVDAGFRYTSETTSADSPQSPQINQSATETPLAYNIGVNYHPEDWVLFASYAHGFRVPFLDEEVSAYGSATDVFYTDLVPETSDTFETGASYLWNHLKFAADTYVLLMQNEIQLNTSTYVNQNVGSSTRWGVSPSITYDFTPFTASIAWNHLYAISTAPGSNGDFVPLVSPDSLTTSVAYLTPWNVNLQTDYRYDSPYYRGGDSTNSSAQIQGRNLWNASASWTPAFYKELTVKLSAYNMLNDRTPTYVYGTGYYPSEPFKMALGASWKL